MQMDWGPDGVRVLGVSDLNVEQTLESGQCFRWTRCADGTFEGITGRSVCRVRREADGALAFLNVTPDAFEQVWRPYFDLDTDYAAIRQHFPTTGGLADACRYAGGIRILRQDGWEALAGFILSQNNHIKRITGIIDRLCGTFGEPIDGERFSFPDPTRLAGRTVEDLAPIRAGFRARYLLDAAQKVASGEIDLAAVATMPPDVARATLRTIVGVGAKVADCALLFGFYRLECFPIDVWIARAQREWLPEGLPDELLPWAGVAQQMLFHYIRTSPDCKAVRG